nr:unnamed protein product [Callosobruchus chinensis]
MNVANFYRHIFSYKIGWWLQLEDYRSVKNMTTENCYMTSLDLKDAYFVIPISIKYRKFLRFKFKNTLFEFCCMPFGLCMAPFVFTKLLKPVNFKLRSLGKSEEECLRNVVETVKILCELGFIVNFPKSNLLPQKQCIFLGFKWNSQILLSDQQKTN